MISDGWDPVQVAYAAQHLEEGGLVAFPTETVYGLGANARDVAAIAKIYELKGRPRHHPLIVHIGRDADPGAWSAEISPLARRVMSLFWPGPLTIILPRADGVPAEVAGGQSSVGLRMPDHPVALALLTAFANGRADSGIAAPSANAFGRISPTSADHVRDEFGDAVMILDGGSCPVGIESTILDLTREATLGPMVLRPGAVTAAMLTDAMGRAPLNPDRNAPRVSGALAAHYAPRKALRIVDAADLASATTAIAVWAFRAAPPQLRSAPWLAAPISVDQYAESLYAVLREFDRSSASEIWIEAPPTTAVWDGVWDRLSRATAGSGR